MKKLLTISILLILLSGCASTKNLNCTNTSTGDNDVITKTIIKVYFSKEENKILKLEETISRTLDNKVYNSLQAKAYMDALKNDEICEQTKSLLKNNKDVSCNIDYKEFEAIIKYKYNLEKLDKEDRDLVLNGKQTLDEYQKYLKENGYSCK